MPKKSKTDKTPSTSTPAIERLNKSVKDFKESDKAYKEDQRKYGE